MHLDSSQHLSLTFLCFDKSGMKRFIQYVDEENFKDRLEEIERCRGEQKECVAHMTDECVKIKFDNYLDRDHVQKMNKELRKIM